MNKKNREDDMSLFRDEDTYGSKYGELHPVDDITVKEVIVSGLFALGIILVLAAIVIRW